MRVASAERRQVLVLLINMTIDWSQKSVALEAASNTRSLPFKSGLAGNAWQAL